MGSTAALYTSAAIACASSLPQPVSRTTAVSPCCMHTVLLSSSGKTPGATSRGGLHVPGPGSGTMERGTGGCRVDSVCGLGVFHGAIGGILTNSTARVCAGSGGREHTKKGECAQRPRSAAPTPGHTKPNQTKPNPALAPPSPQGTGDWLPLIPMTAPDPRGKGEPIMCGPQEDSPQSPSGPEPVPSHPSLSFRLQTGGGIGWELPR